MDNNSIQQTITPHSSYEFKPDFDSALEREVTREFTASSESVKTDLSDSFGSWYEWD